MSQPSSSDREQAWRAHECDPRLPEHGRLSGGDLVRLVLEQAFESLPPLLAGLSCLALPLDRRLLVVRAPLHLLKEAVLEHLLLELLQGGLDLVVEDDDFHSGRPEMPRRSTVGLVRDRVVDDIHLPEPL